MEIVPHIHLIDGVRGANSYLVETGEALVLVDTGLPGNGRRIATYIAKLGKGHEGIALVLLTHADIDHSGSVAELVEVFGAKVAIHRKDAPRLAGETKLKELDGIWALAIDFLTRFSHFRPVVPDIKLENGDEIYGLKVIHTPGHTQGHICLLAPGDVLFAGDALRITSRGRLKGPSRGVTPDLEQAIHSLRSLSNLSFDAVLPGHGKPIVGGGREKLKRLLSEMSSYGA